MTPKILKNINKININYDETVTDQLLNMLLVEFYDTDKPNLKNYFKNLHVSDKKASGFESFVKCWVVLEKAVREFLSSEEIKTNKYLIPDFKILKDKKVLTTEESNQLAQLRKVRNYLLHGIETPTENYLNDSFQTLKSITEKVVNNVPNESVKLKLQHELTKI